MSRRIGIEVGSTAVRIAVVRSGRGGVALLGWAEEPLPLGAVSEGGVAEPRAVGKALVAAARAAKVAPRFGTKRRVHLGVSGLRAISRYLTMPVVPDDELASAAGLQALEVIPFPHERTLLTARRLHSREEDGWMAVLVEAAHRDLVEPMVAAVEEAGFLVEGVALSSSALVRSLQGGTGSDGAAEAIVSIGAELTTLVVHEQGEVRFVRTIASGGATVTRALAATLDIPFCDAEAMKRRLADASADTTSVPYEAVAAARDASAPLLSEIRSSVAYYASMPGNADVSSVVMTGGGSQLAGLRERLQFQIGATVVSRSALERLERVRVRADRDHLAQRGAVAIGLALPDGESQRRTDLLPPEILERRRQRRLERSLATGAGVIVVAVAAVGAVRYLQVRDAENSVSQLRGSVTVLEHEMPTFDSAQRLADAARADEALAVPLVSHEVDWPAVLRALATYTPPQVTTTSFSGTASAGTASASASTAGSTGSPAASATADPSVAPAGSADLPGKTETLGTVDVGLSGDNYPQFQQWFDAMDGSRRFAIVQFSGLTASSKSVDFTAVLDVEGALHTSRLGRFEGLKP